MDTRGQRRSENFQDRGYSRGGGRGAGAAGGILALVVRRFGLSGLVVAGIGLAVVYFVAPDGVRQALFGGAAGPGSEQGQGAVCEASPANASACDFSRVVLASTEDVWSAAFAQGALPGYRTPVPAQYPKPTLAVFSGAVDTQCGQQTSAVGPFYCPGDRTLFIDPAFYTTMARELRAPGDFAQAYVIAHEVGHHVQNLIGATRVKVPGETANQISVRVELQADCFAGVWGHAARASLKINDEDLAEATRAAHAIGDDSLGHEDKAKFTHGSSEQRIRWFRRGFSSGDARQCDTFAVPRASEL
ncbi:MAG: neutral zinc metallopeptidase [Polyangiaceae bacterium]